MQVRRTSSLGYSDYRTAGYIYEGTWSYTLIYLAGTRPPLLVNMLLSASLGLLSLGLVSAKPVTPGVVPVGQTTCNGEVYTYEELAGYGFLPGDARDKTGDTIGGIGSAIALDKKSWKKKKGDKEGYEGIVYGLPDRGWNTQGTQNTQSRIQKFSISFDIVTDATVAKPASPNVQLKYLDTILLTGPDGTPTTGLDADPSGHLSYKGFPDLPVATCKPTLIPRSYLHTDNLKILATDLEETGQVGSESPLMPKDSSWVIVARSG